MVDSIRSSGTLSFFAGAKKGAGGGSGLGASAGASFDRVSLSGSNPQLYQNINEAVRVLSIARDALREISEISGQMETIAAEASKKLTKTTQRERLAEQFEDLKEQYQEVISAANKKAGIDLQSSYDLDTVLSRAGLSKELKGDLGKLLQSLGGKDQTLATEELTDTFAKVYETKPSKTTNEQTSYTISTYGLSTRMISDDILKGGTAISGLKLVPNGTTAAVFNTTANYFGDNGSAYNGIAIADSAQRVTDVLFNAGTPTGNLKTLDISGDGTYALVTDSATNQLQVMNLSTGATVRNLLAVADPNQVQAASAYDGQNIVYYEDVGGADQLTFSTDQGVTVDTISATLNGPVRAGDTRFVFSSNDVSLGSDGSNYDLYFSNGYGSGPALTKIDVASIAVGATLNTSSVAISKDGSKIGFTVDYPGVTGALYLYSVGGGTGALTGLTDVTDVSISDDGDTTVVAQNVSGTGSIKIYQGGGGSTLGSLSATASLGSKTVGELSVNNGGTAFAFSLETGLESNKDEAFISEINTSFTGSDASTETYLFRAGSLTTVVQPSITKIATATVANDQPLEVKASSRAEATLANKTFKTLKEEIDKDILRINSVFESLGGNGASTVNDSEILAQIVAQSVASIGGFHVLNPDRVKELLIDE